MQPPRSTWTWQPPPQASRRSERDPTSRSSAEESAWMGPPACEGAPPGSVVDCRPVPRSADLVVHQRGARRERLFVARSDRRGRTGASRRRPLTAGQGRGSSAPKVNSYRSGLHETPSALKPCAPRAPTCVHSEAAGLGRVLPPDLRVHSCAQGAPSPSRAPFVMDGHGPTPRAPRPQGTAKPKRNRRTRLARPRTVGGGGERRGCPTRTITGVGPRERWRAVLSLAMISRAARGTAGATYRIATRTRRASVRRSNNVCSVPTASRIEQNKNGW